MDTGEQNKKRIDWRRGNFPTWLKLVLAVAVVMMLLLVLFRVRTFEVSGNVRYSVDEIAQASGITQGDILMGINKTRTASRLLVKLPYLEEVVIHKSLPGTVSFEVRECTAVAIAVSEYGTFWSMNGEGKLLEEVEDPDETGNSAYPLITGPLLTLPTGGDPAVFLDSALGSTALGLAKDVEDVGLTGSIQEINVENPEDIYMLYQDRIELHLGNGSDGEYKLQYFKAVLSSLEPDASGVLDMSFSTGEQAIFHPIV